MKQKQNNFSKLVTVILFSLVMVVVFSSYDIYQKQNQETEIIEILLKNFGKCKILEKEFFEITKIKKKHITSAFNYLENDTVKSIPVNDEVFNYKYFYKKLYPVKEDEKVKLTVRKYLINEKIVLVAVKIE